MSGDLSVVTARKEELLASSGSWPGISYEACSAQDSPHSKGPASPRVQVLKLRRPRKGHRGWREALRREPSSGKVCSDVPQTWALSPRTGNSVGPISALWQVGKRSWGVCMFSLSVSGWAASGGVSSQAAGSRSSLRTGHWPEARVLANGPCVHGHGMEQGRRA